MEKVHLRLYLTLLDPEVLDKLKDILDRNLKDNYDLDVINIIKQPEKAEEDNIIATPALVKRSPLPVKMIIGDLSNEQKVLELLEI